MYRISLNKCCGDYKFRVALKCVVYSRAAYITVATHFASTPNYLIAPLLVYAPTLSLKAIRTLASVCCRFNSTCFPCICVHIQNCMCDLATPTNAAFIRGLHLIHSSMFCVAFIRGNTAYVHALMQVTLCVSISGGVPDNLCILHADKR